MQNAGRRILFTADARFAIEPPATGRGPGTLKGYALVWNVTSSDRGGYRVRLLPGSATFQASCRALFEHAPFFPIGHTDNGTLRILPPDDYGSPIEIELPDTQTGRDTAYLVGAKYVRGMSFAMVGPVKGKAKREGAVDVFEASSFEVDEVTVTGAPAFAGTSIELATPAAAAAAAADAPGGYAKRARHALQLDLIKLRAARLQ